MDAPRTIPIEQGVVRPVLILGAERIPVSVGILAWFVMGYIAMVWNPRVLYVLPLLLLWHGVWVLAAVRDPQYSEILWRTHVTYRWPELLHAAPGVLAKRVKVEPSVPIRG